MWNMERKEGPGPRRGNTWPPWRAFQGDSEDDAQSGAPEMWQMMSPPKTAARLPSGLMGFNGGKP